MRICILNDNFYRGSGITRVIERLAHCPAFGEVDLYLAGCSSLERQGAGAREASIVPANRTRSFGLMSGGPRLLPELLRFARWLRATGCELIHVHHRRLAVLARFAGGALGIPVLFTGHLTFPQAGWFQALAPAWATGVSPSVVAYLKRATRAREVSLIYNPLPFDEPAPQPRAALKVMSVGRLEAVKGHTHLIEAWALLKQSGIRAELDIYGEGPLRPALEQLIGARGLEREVTLRGFAPDLRDRYGAYAFHVLPSETEGFPNAVVEAAASRTPTLLNDVPGSRDTLPDGLVLPNGLRFGDPAQWAGVLAQWLRSPAGTAQDGARFHDSLRSLCRPEIVGAQYVALYRRMLGRAEAAATPAASTARERSAGEALSRA